MTSPDGAGLGSGPEKVGQWNMFVILADLGRQVIVWALSHLMAWVFDGEPEDFDTYDEVRDAVEAWLLNLPLVGDIVKVVQGITTGLTGVLATAASLVGLRWLQVDKHEADITTNTAAIAELSEAMRALAVTPVWASLDRADIVSFPRDLLARTILDVNVNSGGSHSHNVTGSTANSTVPSSGSGSHNHSNGSLSTSSVGSTHGHNVSISWGMPTVRPGKGVVDYTPIFVDRGEARARWFKVATGDSSFWGSIFGIDYWILALCVYNPATGNVEKVWDGGDRKGSLTSSEREFGFDMGTGLGELFPGQVLFAAQLQNAGVLTDTRAIAAINQSGLQPAVPGLIGAPSFTLSGQSSIPSAVALSSLTPQYSYKPWAGVTVEPV